MMKYSFYRQALCQVDTVQMETDMDSTVWVNPNGNHYCSELDLRRLNTCIKYSHHVFRIMFDVWHGIFIYYVQIGENLKNATSFLHEGLRARIHASRLGRSGT